MTTAASQWNALPSVLALLIWASALGAANQDCTIISKDVTFYFGVETPLPEPNYPVTIDFFHADLDVSFGRSGWEIGLGLDEPDGEQAHEPIGPEQALIYANANARITLPSLPAGFEFIGAEPGSTFWVLPQSEGTGALPLGLAAEHADSARLCPWNPGDCRGANSSEKWFALRLLAVRGPAGAHFSTWQTQSNEPPVVYMSTWDSGIDEGDVMYISAGSHVHMNWGFTRSGVYEVDFRITTVYLCESWFTADIAPQQADAYRGDCIVDFRDLAMLASAWLKTGCGGESDLCGGSDFAQPTDETVNWAELALLAEQWLQCGYPGCEARALQAEVIH